MSAEKKVGPDLSLPPLMDPELAAIIREEYGWDYPVETELRPDLHIPEPTEKEWAEANNNLQDS